MRQESLRSAEPARGLGQLASVGQLEAQPEGAARRATRSVRVEEGAVGPLEQLDGVVVVTGEVRGVGELPQVVGRQGPAPVREREVVEGVEPRPLAEGFATPLECVLAGHVGARGSDPAEPGESSRVARAVRRSQRSNIVLAA